MLYFLAQESFADEQLRYSRERNVNQAGRMKEQKEPKKPFNQNSRVDNKTSVRPKHIQSEFHKYLNQKDNSYQWKLVHKIPHNAISLIELTSQTWHEITWKHYMLVVMPKKIAYKDHALLYIGGGSNGNKPSYYEMFQLPALAEKVMMPVVMLFQVPNQPLDPAKKGGKFYEDALIGETFVKTMETKDMSWALLLPMTKSVIRAMDASQEYIRQEYNLNIKKFIVSGASKRGWTTWLTAASNDSRVAGIVPIVYNNLNLLRQLEGHIEMWGKFSPQIHDYIDRGLFKKNEIPSPEKLQLINMIDPYSYLSHIRVPKLLIHGANDPYWPTNATTYYWDDIKEPKYILTLPNTDHNIDIRLGIAKVIDTIAVFTQHVASGKKLPKIEWTLIENETHYQVLIKTDFNNPKMKLWTANPDFQDTLWKSAPFINNVTIIEKPKSGHIAFFIELESHNENIQLSLTTEVWRF
jgi:PhoPQ-activated pathogenicity-related protein